MKPPTPDKILRLWGASLILILSGATSVLITYAAADRRTAIRRASEQTLLDATFAAVSLDAVLRKAELEVKAASLPGSFEGKSMAKAAFGVHEADNIYLLDDRGAVLETAYARRDASIDGTTAAFERLESGVASDCRIVNAPAEGGPVLALLSIVPASGGGRRYAAVLFTGFSMFGELTSLGSGLYESMEMLDQNGRTLSIIEPKGATGRRIDSALRAEVPLASVPIVISTSSDKGHILAAWRGRAAILAALVAVFGAVLAGMFVYALRLWNRANTAAELQKEVERQDLLFQEVNHRIKNNLAVIITVLQLGAEKAAERPASAGAALASAIDRVRAIELLHELLYKKPKSLREDFGAYIESLAQALSETYGHGGLLSIETTHDEGICFSLDKTVALALMINEIVTNAYKHAFPDGQRGTITLNAAKAPDGGVIIQVSDDGIGMEGGNPASGGLGTTLMEALAGQLNAQLSKTGNHPSGTTWTIHILPEPAVDFDPA